MVLDYLQLIEFGYCGESEDIEHHFHAYLIRLLIEYIQLIDFASLLPKKICRTIQGFQTHGAYSLHWVDSTCRESTSSSSSLDLNKDRQISQPADTDR